LISLQTDGSSRMNISILTVFPALYEQFLETSLLKKATGAGIVDFNLYRFADCVPPKKRIDEPACGPGAGMVIRPEVVEAAVDVAEKKSGRAFKIFFSPHGTKLDQKKMRSIVKKISEQNKTHLMLVAARYEGMDLRVEDEYADEIISIGDYVLMGGDLPAMVFLEAFLRLVPGVVGDQESVVEDSFTGPFVDYPNYCLPVQWHDRTIPEILRSGDHKKINVWRTEQAVKRTLASHFDWLRHSPVTSDQKALVRSFIPPHYVVLMHDQVMTGPEKIVGTTSVTSLDIHDIARSAATYGIKKYFLVTPLLDQQKIVAQFLEFWHEGGGVTYNESRHVAIKEVVVKASLELTIAAIFEAEGKMPLVIATSAQKSPRDNCITFHDQGVVWSHDRPVLLVLGTGRGLTDALLAKVDFVLVPVEGCTDYNHLSVRSAAAIIFDRWLGLNPQ
jgi:tRNA (guanine37-N1)-methyltransferase